jgi:hypothetical protein
MPACDAGRAGHGSIGGAGAWPGPPDPCPPVKRLLQAPNAALATLWADQLTAAGIDASVQRLYACAIAGQIPPDQALPEVWVQDDERLDEARALLDAWRRAPWRHWACFGCGEVVDGPFESCWNCGAACPAGGTGGAG